MIADSIRSLVHLLMFRRTQRNVDCASEEAPSRSRGLERRVDISAGPLRAYVSFAHSDADFAHSLATTLQQQHGLAAFFKEHSSRDSHYLDRVIPMAIESADVFIVLLSPATMKSNYLARELRLAFRKDKQIVPVYIDSIDLEVPWPDPFDHLRGITALRLEEFSIEEVAEKIAGLMAAE